MSLLRDKTLWKRGVRLSVADGAGRLVIKDMAILSGAVVVLSDSAKRVLEQLKKWKNE